MQKLAFLGLLATVALTSAAICRYCGSDLGEITEEENKQRTELKTLFQALEAVDAIDWVEVARSFAQSTYVEPKSPSDYAKLLQPLTNVKWIQVTGLLSAPGHSSHVHPGSPKTNTDEKTISIKDFANLFDRMSKKEWSKAQEILAANAGTATAQNEWLHLAKLLGTMGGIDWERNKNLVDNFANPPSSGATECGYTAKRGKRNGPKETHSEPDPKPCGKKGCIHCEENRVKGKEELTLKKAALKKPHEN